jgi:CHAT domain-containing protein/tetratricopeptide (TPR) repeat protein
MDNRGHRRQAGTRTHGMSGGTIWLGWLLLLLCVLPATAANPALVREEIDALITTIQPGEGAVREAEIDRGSDDGLVVGWRGTVWAHSEKLQDHERKVADIGACEILALTPRTATIRLTMTKPEGDGLVRVGDWVAIKARVPALPGRSLLWRLAKLHITLMDVNNEKPYNAYRALYSGESPEMLAPIYTEMLENIAWTGREFADGVAPDPIKGGRYNGKTLRQVMEAATRKDLDNFFLFVAGFPGKYLGKQWKLNEVFATWVINAAPIGQEELRLRLLEAKTPAERATLIATYRKDIADGNMIGDWYSDVQALSGNDQHEAALALADVALEAARQLQRADDESWCLFAKAYALENAERYPEALAAFDVAVAAFRARQPQNDDGVKGVSFSLAHRGGILATLTRYQEALPVYEEALRLRQGVPALAATQGNTYWAIGNTQYNLGEYKKALAAYEQALPFTRAAQDTEGLTSLLAWMAKVYARVGDNAGAERMYTEAIAICRREQARAAEAETQSKLGNHYWGIGKYADALASYQQALRMQRELDALAEVGTTLTGIGKLYWNLGDYAKALAAHTEALTIRRTLKDRAGEAESLKELGDLHQHSGDYAAALEAYAGARDIAAALGNQQLEASIATKLADIHQTQRKYPQALATYDRVVKLYRDLALKSDLALALYSRGVLLERLQRFPEAEKDHLEALTLRQAMAARADEAESLLALSNLAWRRQDYAGVAQRLQDALTIARAIKDRLLEARCTRFLGIHHELTLRFPEALDAYTRALAIYRDPAVGDVAGEIETLLNLGSYANTRGDYPLAQQYYDAALKLAEKTKARPQQCNALSSIGWLHRVSGRLDDALAAQQQALVIAEEVDDLWTRASTYHAIAVLYSDFGQNAKGIAYAEKAMQLNADDQNPNGQVIVGNALGVYYYRQGDYVRSDQYLRESLALAEKLNSQPDVLTALGNLCELAMRQGQYTQAAALLQRALPISKMIDNGPSLVDMQVLLARVKRLEGEATAAAAPPRAAGLYQDAAGALGVALAKARELTLPGYIVEVQMEAAQLALAQGRPAEGVAPLAEAVHIATARKFRHQLWELYYQQGRLLLALERLPEAEASLQQSMAVLDELQGGVAGGEKGKETFIRSRIKVYETMAEVLGALNATEKDPVARQQRAERALTYVAYARFQVVSSVAGTVDDTGDAVLNEALRRRDDVVLRQGQIAREVKDALEAGNTEKAERLDRVLARTEEELAGTYADIKAQDADLDARLKFDPRRLADAVRDLPDKAVLLVLFPGQDDLHLWVYTNEGFKEWRRRPVGRKELYGLVNDFRKGIDEVISHVERRERLGRGFGSAAEANTANPQWYRDNISGMRGTLAKLYGHLIAPVEADIANADPLIILPYGQLCYLPFEALTRQEADGKLTFLGQERRVAYLTSEDHLRETLRALARPLSDKGDAWVAFADPRGRLGSSLTEANDIAAFFPTHEIHSNATGTAGKDQVEVLRDDCTILHFATHGFLNGAKPSQTYLELASPPGDGMLSQSEIWPRLKNLSKPFKNRRLRLVVLSACETARGQEAPEAEVLGLPDAFTMAGVPAVIGSLWSVYTYTTTDFMVDFYRLLAQQKQSKAQAMQQARRTMITQDDGRYAHPFYWAPFLLFGDWR